MLTTIFQKTAPNTVIQTTLPNARRRGGRFPRPPLYIMYIHTIYIIVARKCKKKK